MTTLELYDELNDLWKKIDSIQTRQYYRENVSLDEMSMTSVKLHSIKVLVEDLKNQITDLAEAEMDEED